MRPGIAPANIFPPGPLFRVTKNFTAVFAVPPAAKSLAAPGERTPLACGFRRLAENLVPQTYSRQNQTKNVRRRFGRTAQTGTRAVCAAHSHFGFQVYRNLMFDVRSLYFTTRALAGFSRNDRRPPSSLQFTVQFCRPKPSQARASCSSPDKCEFVCLKKNLTACAAPPPLVRSDAAKVPHPTQPTQFQYSLALKHPLCRPVNPKEKLKIRRNS